MENYTAKVFEIKDITEDLKLDLADLYLNNYENTDFETFNNDLMEKTFILCIYFEDKVVGFSTLKNYIHEYDNKKYAIIYSGDTIVHKNHWGQQLLAKEWIKLVKKVKLLNSELPLYWFLIVKGHRTFKYLNAFANRYYPNVRYEDEFLKNLSISLAKEKFGKQFNEKTGVIEFSSLKASLIEDLSEVSEEQLKNENTQFFLRKNPGYKKGDELVCCCSLDIENMNAITLRIYKRA